ncbi:hypothetical protein KA005_63660 [bacterium]|nr:hypothetical protein [bacterium]
MICKVEKIQPGSVVCDPNDPKQLYRIIEHKTVFSGFDFSDGLSYGETKRICRMRDIGSDRVFRYPSFKQVIFIEGPRADAQCV